ncbi:MAG: PSD1 domain-containing protein [Bryobacterales bacterium]|nr:PSD1 domain-containing protein [Acidobacteriota bacterium]MCB9383531.1 PSD1 domain-containing protein [Bryobacterales bacterium]
MLRLNRKILALTLLTGAIPGAAVAQGADAELFEKKIRPLFAEKCQVCHGAAQQMGGLDLETAKGFRKGGAHGPVVSAEAPAQSRLLAALSYEQPLRMPPTGKLSDAELADVRRWVEMGAPWPEAPAGNADAASTLWSFQPVRKPAAPAVADEAWARNDVDRFLLAKMEEQGLKPAPPADKLTWLRRATFDLVGLPPTPAEMDAFLADESEGAYEAVVERLLASPRYGERWGRHWLDVARYADSTGADEDHRYPYAWRYRDYVIKAFNDDKPYDRFVQEQIAGDLMPPDDPNARVNAEGIVATGFLALGTKLIAEIDKPKLFYDVVDEQIDTTSKAFLGLTLACARCHDHKFDPLPTTDYYAMASIFASTKQFEDLDGAVVSKLYFRPIAPDDEVAAYEASNKEIADKKAEISKVEGRENKRYRDQRAPQLAAYMLAAYKVYAGGQDAAALAKQEGLEQDVLERMAEYLKPQRERRPQLEGWYAATDRTRPLAAQQYQDSFLATIELRENADKTWEKEAAAAKAAGKPAPERPKFFAGDDRFFTEINAAKGPFGLPEEKRDAFYLDESKAALETLRAELKTLEDKAPNPPMACAVNEGEIVDQKVLVRGNVHNPGEPVAKRFPIALAGRDQAPITSGSGRLELAHWLGSEHNPLTARVMANRLWQWHFGEGLVRTPNNFGKLGEKPTHPELLDYLAARFVESGWSIKQMHRLLMLSSAYRMSADATPEQREKDQENRYWSRFEPRRLEVEEMRDSLLTLDGSLDLTVGGALMEGQGTDKEFSDARKSLHPDSTKRRTVYLPVRRSNLPTLFSLFDFGDAAISNAQRTQTNVAPQALYMMNSVFVEERAGALASELLKDEALDDAGRVREAYRIVLNRPATADRVDQALSYIAGFPTDGADDGRSLAWTSFCRTLIASNQFLYVN